MAGILSLLKKFNPKHLTSDKTSDNQFKPLTGNHDVYLCTSVVLEQMAEKHQYNNSLTLKLMGEDSLLPNIAHKHLLVGLTWHHWKTDTQVIFTMKCPSPILDQLAVNTWLKWPNTQTTHSPHTNFMAPSSENDVAQPVPPSACCMCNLQFFFPRGGHQRSSVNIHRFSHVFVLLPNMNVRLFFYTHADRMHIP